MDPSDKNDIIITLDRLIDVSREMLDILKSRNPSVDDLEELLARRGQLVDTMDSLSNNFESSLYSEEEQAKLMKGFSTFRELHLEIQPELQKLVAKQEDEFVQASKRRKAEDGYHTLGTPDITFFSDKSDK